MNPYILRQLDIALVKHAVELFQKKLKDISEDDWHIIIRYYKLIEALTLHHEPVLTAIEKLTTLREIHPSDIEFTLLMLREQYEKDRAFYIRNGKITEEQEKQEKDIWVSTFTKELPPKLKINMGFQYWLTLFQNIKDKDNISKEVEKIYITFLSNLIEKTFPKDKEKYLKKLDNPQQIIEVINALIKNDNSLIFLKAYPNAKEKVEKDKRDLFFEILSENLKLLQQENKTHRYGKFCTDALRGTQLSGIDISVNTLDETSVKELVLIDVTKRLKESNVSNHLINYIFNYVNQNGITNSGSNFFGIESNNQGILFTEAIKQIRIEVIAPNKIRVLTPILYTSYMHTDTNKIVKRENPIYIELTSLIIEDKNPQGLTYSPEDITVSIEECFNELFEADITEKWSLKSKELTIQKLIDNIPLEKFEKQLITSYLTPAQKLKDLDDASPMSLVMLMLKDYKHAIDIMKDEKLINKVLMSPYNTYIDKIYEKHLFKSQFAEEKTKINFWKNYTQLKVSLTNIIELSHKIEHDKTKPDDISHLKKMIDIVIILIKSTDDNALYQIFRTFNNKDLSLLLTHIELATTLTTTQLIELIKINQDIALILLTPKSNDAKLLLNHPSNQLTQQQLVEILTIYPEFWSTPQSGFDKNIPSPTSEQKKAGLLVQNKHYRYELSGDSLVLCAYSENPNARNAAINAIATDEVLAQKLFASKKLMNNLPKLLMLYLESPDNIRSKIIQIPIFNDFISKIDDNKLKKQLISDRIKHLSFANLIKNINNELNAAKPNAMIIELYKDAMQLHLSNEFSRTSMLNHLELAWIHSIKDKAGSRMQHFLNHHFSPELLQISSINQILNTDSNTLYNFVIDVIPDNNSYAYYYLLNKLKSLLKQFNDADFSTQLSLIKDNKSIILFQNLFYSYCFENYWNSIENDDVTDLYRMLIEHDRKLDNLLTYIIENKKVDEKAPTMKHAEALKRVLTSTEISKIVFNRFVLKYQRRELTSKDYKLLATLYIHDTEFKKLLNSQSVLLQNLIENSDLPELINLMKYDNTLTKQIIFAITSQVKTKNRMLGNNEQKLSTDNDIRQFITLLLKNVLQQYGKHEFENCVQLFMILQKNPQVSLEDIILKEPEFKSQFNIPINQLSQNKSLSPAKQFISMPDDEQNELVKNKNEMANIINSANTLELNAILSKHKTLNYEWLVLISQPNHKIRQEICEVILNQNPVLTDLVKAYLYTTPENKSIILKSNLLLNRMLCFDDYLLDLYIHDEFLRNYIENDINLINAMLNTAQRPDDWFDLYMTASLNIREMMLSNNKIFYRLILMASENNLLKLVATQPELSSKILSNIFEYYLTTEYMKYFVNKNPLLLNRMLDNLNENQLISLLTQNPKHMLIEAITDNDHCSTLFVNLNVKAIPEHRKILDKIYDKHPDIKLPPAVIEILREQKEISLKSMEPRTVAKQAPTGIVQDTETQRKPHQSKT